MRYWTRSKVKLKMYEQEMTNELEAFAEYYRKFTGISYDSSLIGISNKIKIEQIYPKRLYMDLRMHSKRLFDQFEEIDTGINEGMDTRMAIRQFISAVKRFESDVLDGFYELVSNVYEIPMEVKSGYSKFRDDYNLVAHDLERYIRKVNRELKTSFPDYFERAEDFVFINKPSSSIDESLQRFIELSKNIPALGGIVLYGSYARGERNPRDIDLLLIFDSDPDKYSAKVSELVVRVNPPVPINTLLTDLTDLDESLLQNIMEEGKTLFGKFVLTPEKIGKKSYRIVSYSLKGLDSTTKMAVHRNVYGYTSRKKVKDKEYFYEGHGLKDEKGVSILGRGVIALPKNIGDAFVGFLDRNHVKHTVINAWI